VNVGNLTQTAAFHLVVEFGANVSTADQHRKWAATCLELAQKATDDKARSLYLLMAEAWHALAEKAEAHQDDQTDD
jgi:hypothetical protein